MPGAKGLSKKRSATVVKSPASATYDNARFLPTSSPAFQPPSYYAAAGGLSLNSLDLAAAGPSMRHPESEVRRDAKHTEPDRLRKRESSTLAAYPSGSLTEDEFQIASRRRSLKLLQKSNRLSTLKPDAAPSKARGHQLRHLPSVEAQLLPSLRDTIYRMTKPPMVSGATDESRPERDPNRSLSIDHRLHAASSASSFSSAASESFSAPLSPHDRDRTQSAYPSTAAPCVSDSNGRLLSVASAHQNNAARKPLKSALRSPAISSPNAVGNSSPASFSHNASSSSAAASLRTVPRTPWTREVSKLPVASKTPPLTKRSDLDLKAKASPSAYGYHIHY